MAVPETPPTSVARLLIVVVLTLGSATSTALAVAGSAAPAVPAAPPVAADGIYPIVFPVAGSHSYTDSWGAPRSQGRVHRGTDIFAVKGTPVVAAADGVVITATTGPRAGRYLVIEHGGGWRTLYMHLNNDSVGTDDGRLGSTVDGIAVGTRVAAGDLIDHVGDSGNAEDTPPHLHLEIHDASGRAVNPYPSLRAAEDRPLGVAAEATASTLPPFTAENVAYVGSFDPGGGFAADIAVHGGVAYLSTWGRPEMCPATGVRMIDVSDPLAPVLLAAIAAGGEFPATGTDSVWVGAIDTPAFAGDLAVVALRMCDTSEQGRRVPVVRGLASYDVTDPSQPRLLGFFDTGPKTQGVHELDVTVRDDGTVLAAATVLQSLPHTTGEVGDLRIIDITDPAAPQQLADWDLRRDGPVELIAAIEATVYDEFEWHLHSATWSDGGTRLWIAAWDAGIVVLDTSEVAAPGFITTFGFDPAAEGNAHSVAWDVEAGLLIRNDRDLINAAVERHSLGWGGQRFYDISDLGSVPEVAVFRTERSRADDDGAALHGDGRYSAHNAVLRRGLEFVSWYSDGLRIVDVSDPAAPVEKAYFIPPLRPDPQGFWDAPDGTLSFAMVWGVAVVGDLVYVSDMNSGLWIIQYPIPPLPEERPHVLRADYGPVTPAAPAMALDARARVFDHR